MTSNEKVKLTLGRLAVFSELAKIISWFFIFPFNCDFFKKKVSLDSLCLDYRMKVAAILRVILPKLANF